MISNRFDREAKLKSFQKNYCTSVGNTTSCSDIAKEKAKKCMAEQNDSKAQDCFINLKALIEGESQQRPPRTIIALASQIAQSSKNPIITELKVLLSPDNSFSRANTEVAMAIIVVKLNSIQSEKTLKEKNEASDAVDATKTSTKMPEAKGTSLIALASDIAKGSEKPILGSILEPFLRGKDFKINMEAAAAIITVKGIEFQTDGALKDAVNIAEATAVFRKAIGF